MFFLFPSKSFMTSTSVSGIGRSMLHISTMMELFLLFQSRSSLFIRACMSVDPVESVFFHPHYPCVVVIPGPARTYVICRHLSWSIFVFPSLPLAAGACGVINSVWVRIGLKSSWCGCSLDGQASGQLVQLQPATNFVRLFLPGDRSSTTYQVGYTLVRQPDRKSVV